MSVIADLRLFIPARWSARAASRLSRRGPSTIGRSELTNDVPHVVSLQSFADTRVATRTRIVSDLLMSLDHSYEGPRCQVPAVSEIDCAHLHSRRRSGPCQVLGPRRWPPLSRCQSHLHWCASAHDRIPSRAGGCRFAWSSTQTTTNSYSCQSQRTDHQIT